MYTVYSETSISGPRYPDLLDIRTKIWPDIEPKGCVINKDNVPIIYIYIYIYSISGPDIDIYSISGPDIEYIKQDGRQKYIYIR
jgi:hypothetical protein